MFAFNITEPPLQNVVDEAGVMVAVGGGEDNTKAVTDDQQPLLENTATLYGPAEFTTLEAPVEPSNHKYVTPPLAVNVTLGVLQSIVDEGGLMLEEGAVVFDVITLEAVAVHPFPVETITE